MRRGLTAHYFIWILCLMVFLFAVNFFADWLFDRIPAFRMMREGFLEQHYEFAFVLLANTLVAPIVLFATWRVARQLARPILEMAATADRIESGDFLARMPPLEGPTELRQLAQSFNRALDQYQELANRTRRSAEATAHQLRTPLAALRLMAELAADKPGADAEWSHLTERVEGMESLVEKLLTLATLAGRQSVSEHQVVDLDRLALDTLALFQPLMELRRLQAVVVPASPACVAGDETLLQQALVNLLDNACRCTPEGGRIEIALLRVGTHIHLQVADSGPGFPPEVLRGEPTVREGRAGGFGLAIVREIVRTHEGRLELGPSAFGGALATMILRAA